MSHVELYRQEVAKLIGTGTHDDPVRPWGTKLGKWRWRFVADNGRVMADSGQGYSRRIDCLNGCAMVLGADVSEAGNLVRPAGAGRQYLLVRDLTR